ncbi:hypothetical protein L107_02969 [Cyanobium sp. Copco_Reservoir_LC18]|uniref:hypothetical protein n=1 Tax=Cyanobium sp. Copco_Reservoir_LC18 TaxID=1328305 RepID=UPI00135AF9C9|nr:hypothetical protein [Cyanobium sp. Copco_Reservoir_LC18]KAF0654634.1 hypothetical protein L107_02969 [Cyanobium sp. Copco_Reservoir_LC18]
MAHALVFVLAPEGDLPGDGAAWEDLLAAQRLGIRSGIALRMFRVPAETSVNLDDLVSAGQANVSGADPFVPLRPSPCPEDPSVPPADPAPARRLICDAVVPHLEPRALWLGAYELSGPERPPSGGHPAEALAIALVRCLDQFSLKEADNETCWFYPTENGDYLCWENQRALELPPGYPADACLQEGPVPYQRSDLQLLWSLMADDQALTCVGLTYQKRRIEWPVAASDPEPFATWTAFQVDAMADDTYREMANITVFPA